eukprot:1123359-Amphidinium_carterae.1
MTVRLGGALIVGSIFLIQQHAKTSGPKTKSWQSTTPHGRSAPMIITNTQTAVLCESFERT